MRVTVVAKPGSSRNEVRKLGTDRYEVRVTAVAEKGKANDAVRRLLATTLHRAPSRISLVMGATARVKVFEVQ